MKKHWRRWVLVIPLLLVGPAMVGCDTKTSAVIDPAKTYHEAYLSLRQAAVDPDAHVRAKAMEAFANTLGSASGPILMEGLRDPMGPVCSSAAMGIAETRYAPAHSLLVSMAKDPQIPPKLMCSVAYALHRLGDDEFTGQLAQLLLDKDKWVRCTAAMILGRMGEASAMDLIKSLIWEDHDPVVQLQGREALAELGDERSISLLEAFTKSQFLEDRIIAIQTLGRIGSPRSVAVLKNLLDDGKQDPLVRMAAAGALAKMHDKSGYKLAMLALTDPAKILRESRPKNTPPTQLDIVNLQSMAALALGYMDNRDALPLLAPMIHSPNGTIRVAADEAVMLLLSAYQLSLPTIEPERMPASMPAEMPATAPAAEAPASTEPAPAEPAPATPAAEATPAPTPAPNVAPAVTPEPAPAVAPAPTPAPVVTPAVTPAPAASEPASQPSEQDKVKDLLKSKTPPKLKRAGARD